MIGFDQEGSWETDQKVQLSAGDLLGRTHEELVLLLIQLRRQSSALVKARDACLLEMDSQVNAIGCLLSRDFFTFNGVPQADTIEVAIQMNRLKCR